MLSVITSEIDILNGEPRYILHFLASLGGVFFLFFRKSDSLFDECIFD